MSSRPGVEFTREFFDEYYNGRSRGVAFGLKNIIKFEEHRDLSDYDISAPPQSFTYL